MRPSDASRVRHSQRCRSASSVAVARAGATRPETSHVGRPSKWGNPHRTKPRASAEAVRRYREDLLSGRLEVSVDEVRRELAGKDLACWCPLDQPCHADVLLEIANA